jgi:hypothetical protein
VGKVFRTDDIGMVRNQDMQEKWLKREKNDTPVS